MNIIITITGPSCAGKGYLLDYLLSNYGDNFTSLWGYATRPKREGEIEGFEYKFVDEDFFDAEFEAGNLCQSVTFGGNHYGTPWQSMEEAWETGKVPVRIVEPGGVGQFELVADQLTNSGKPTKVFSVFITDNREVIVERWLERFILDSADPATREESRQSYAKRILGCIEGEFQWDAARPYNFYINQQRHKIPTMAHALSRIASGKVNMEMANRLAPYANMYEEVL